MLEGKEVVLEHIDKETVNKIIEENSIGSRYYENEKRKQAILDKKVEARKMEVAMLQPDQLATAIFKADEVLRRIEDERDLSRTVVHMDMDAFYASVEILSKPHLADVPMAVGSDHMLSTSNYKARSYGVRSAMPGFIAKKLCPSLIIVSPNFSEYERCSALVSQVLATYNPDFSKVGLDEAYIDLTEVVDVRMDGVRMDEGVKEGETAEKIRGEVVEKVVEEMREKIFQVTKLTASAGVAPNCMLAKVCSDMNKPNGQYTIPPNKQAIIHFINKLPIRKINGVGRVTNALLKAEGVETCGDLIDRRAHLLLLNTQHSFEYLMRIALGVGFDEQTDEQPRNDHIPSRKSMSVERTFVSTDNMKELMHICFELCHSLVQDLLSQQLLAKGVTLKLKSDTFKVMTRCRMLNSYCDHFDVFYQASSLLLKQHLKQYKHKIRLMGVRACHFVRADKVATCQKRIIDIFKKSIPPSITHDSKLNHTSSSLSASSSNHITSSSSSFSNHTTPPPSSPSLNDEFFEQATKKLKVDEVVSGSHSSIHIHDSCHDSFDAVRFRSYFERGRKKDGMMLDEEGVTSNNQHTFETLRTNLYGIQGVQDCNGEDNKIKYKTNNGVNNYTINNIINNNINNENNNDLSNDTNNDLSNDTNNNINNDTNNDHNACINHDYYSISGQYSDGFKDMFNTHKINHVNHHNSNQLYQNIETSNNKYNVNKNDNSSYNSNVTMGITEEVICPVCKQLLPSTSNHHLNQHIDECLNLQFIKNSS